MAKERLLLNWGQLILDGIFKLITNPFLLYSHQHQQVGSSIFIIQ